MSERGAYKRNWYLLDKMRAKHEKEAFQEMVNKAYDEKYPPLTIVFISTNSELDKAYKAMINNRNTDLPK